MHLFESRNKAFRDDEVLQENIIIRLGVAASRGTVTVTTSTDDSFSRPDRPEHPFDRIVFPDDPERFIHVPTTTEKSAIELSPAVRYSLADIGIEGIDRSGSRFPAESAPATCQSRAPCPDLPRPPGMTGTVWPVAGLKKPTRSCATTETEKWLYPNGFLLRGAPLFIR